MIRPAPVLPSDLTRSEVIALAEDTAARHGKFDPSGRLNVGQLARSLGGEIDTTTATPAFPLTLWAPGQDRFTIFLPSNTSTARDRYTIAHEVGHLLLHSRHAIAEGPEVFLRCSGTGSVADHQANLFASTLLMPAGSFAEAWEVDRTDLAPIARRFGVSRSAVRVRAAVLGLI